MAILSLNRQKNVRQNRPIEDFAQEQTVKVPRVKLGKLRFPFRKILIYPVAGVFLALLLGTTNQYIQDLPLQDIRVALLNESDNAFLDMDAVKEIIGLDGELDPIGLPMSNLDIQAMELRLKENPFVLQGEITRQLNGVLLIEMELRKPMVRLVNNSGEFVYLDQDGGKFPSSPLHGAHVPLVRGDFEEALSDSFECVTIEAALPVFRYIHEDPFWQAMISEIVIHQDGQLTLMPQVGSIKVEFGQPVRIEEKFEKLMLFYQQVVKTMGWRKYRSVNVKYKDQLVAKKR